MKEAWLPKYAENKKHMYVVCVTSPWQIIYDHYEKSKPWALWENKR